MHAVAPALVGGCRAQELVSVLSALCVCVCVCVCVCGVGSCRAQDLVSVLSAPLSVTPVNLTDATHGLARNTSSTHGNTADSAVQVPYLGAGFRVRDRSVTTGASICTEVLVAVKV